MSGDVMFWLLFGTAVCFLGLLAYEEYVAANEREEKTDEDNIKIGGTD